jgi:VanZ family protein
MLSYIKYKYKIILFVFLAVVTIVCHTYVEQYEKSGPEMLSDHWSVHVPQGSKGEIKQNGLFLFSSDQTKSVNIHQDLSFFERGTILKLSADMKCEDVQPGEKAWNRARLLLVQNDGLKNRYDFPHGVAAIDGFKDWNTYKEVFIVQPGTKRIRVMAQLSKCAGTFQLKNIQLYPVTQTQAYLWAQNGILLLWGVFGIFLLGSCFFLGNKQLILQVILFIAFIAIIVGTTMPGDMKNQVTTEVKNQLQENSYVFEHVLPKNIPKIGHFVFFALFSIMLSLLLKQTPFFIVLLHILMVACGTEMAQFYIDGRTPLFTDFFIDAAGGISGLVFVLLFCVVFSGRHECSSKSIVK